MKLSYFHVPEHVPLDSIPNTAVVIDVLRATTTIAWALNNGAEAVQTFADLEKLRDTASSWDSSARLLLGERGGNRLEGFDLGNSPVAVTKNMVEGKRLFMSTTNGTKALSRVSEAPNLYTCALVNRKAVAERIINEKTDEIFIVGSGWEGSYSLEDSLSAGSLASYILKKSDCEIEVCNDECLSSIALWESWKDDLEGCLRESSHGKRLASIGNHDDDFECCSDLDSLEIVPTQSEMGLLLGA
tara:strand:+ start:15964 stop:16695 length:732 start_codon:yes stop_codon:yes gene_type:complete